MSKTVIATIILSCCFYCVKSDGLCNKIMRTRNYLTAMSNAKNERNRNTDDTERCDMARKYSDDLFRNPYTLMCANYIAKYLEDNKDLYYHARKICSIQEDGYKDLLKCKSLAEFEKCIYTTMPSTLKILADNDYIIFPVQDCKMCFEKAFLKKCAKKSHFPTRCPRVFAGMKDTPLATQEACERCNRSGSRLTHHTTQPRTKTTLNPIVTTKRKNITPPKSNRTTSRTTQPRRKTTMKLIVTTKRKTTTLPKEKTKVHKREETNLKPSVKKTPVGLIVGGISAACGVVIILIGVGYYLTKSYMMDRELAALKGSKTSFASNISFSSIRDK